MGSELLSQNEGVTHTNGANYIQDRRTESLGRHVMLRANYRIGSIGAGVGRAAPSARRPWEESGLTVVF